ncbi:helix-turn-helix transcriptional regulator [Oricola cellulosilytica]|uniref:Helix-turn-helix domain-containing protein n=1 Tax=Oricola cellulosilytica TaxID=1429082 RepID=A0A4R0P4V4_9HYPH|nr:helix-turn-helix transcriptional regulator [Oricola cellulosilytica]TCD11901.1 helix-turn-helix domain-containing protein [Oricola cellulosilytica]
MPDFLTTRELAELLRIKERKVYDLVNSAKVPFTKATGKLLFPREAIEQWIEQSSTVPETVNPTARPPVLLGSHDPVLDWALRESGCGIATYFDGSGDGLDRFEGGEGIAAGLHVFEPDSGEWNIPLVAQRFKHADAVLVEWARRERGLIANPEAAPAIKNLEDMGGRRIAWRQPMSGTQRLLCHLLERAGVSVGEEDASIVSRTEVDAAMAVQDGAADVTFGLRHVADQHGLPFVPIVEERFDLLVSRPHWFEPPFQRFLAFCRSVAFQQKTAALAGYDFSGFATVHFNAGSAD